MKTDISRFGLRLAQRYSGVYQQQGRMITDADWNELVDLLKLRVQEALADVVGSGAPRRTAPGGQALPPVTATGRLLPGPLYAAGLRAQLAASAGTAPAGDGSIGLDQQADFPGFTAPGNRPYILYADLWERPVTALEDPAILDPGLHGADTCTRVQAMAQVKWVEPAATDPLTGLPQRGTAPLAVALRAASAGTDPCDPCAAEVSLPAAVGNYLFRLEVHDVQGPPSKPTGLTLKWSSENGAEAYLADAANRMPPEPFRVEPGHVFEFFSAASEKHLGAHLAAGFKPARLPMAETYAEPSAADQAALLLSGTAKPWVRRWDGYCKLKNTGAGWVPDFDSSKAVDKGNHAGVDAGQLMPAAAGTPGFAGVQNGKLTLTLGALELKLGLEGQAFLAGDYWLAAVRENAPPARQVELASPTPVGIVHQYLRLAEVDATVNPPVVNNAPGGDAGARRLGFPPLTDLTADRVGYDPTRKAARWQDILEVASLGQPPAPANLQQALDELVEKLESGDLPYAVPVCAGAAQTVRRLLLAALADGAASKVKDMLDQLLCGLDASKVPYVTSAAQTVKDVVDDKVGKTGAQTMQGSLTIQQTLTVQQSATMQQNLSVTARATVGQFTMAQGATSGWVLTSDAQGNGTWQQPVARGWDIANNNLYTTVTGNVGIGTQAPAAKLDVEGGALLGYAASLGDAGIPGDFGAPLKSGFYQNAGGSNLSGDVPDASHPWTHLITARHSNTANNHQLQIAATYKNNDRLFFRKVEATTPSASNPTWNEVATRGPNAFAGDQTIAGKLDVQGPALLGVSNNLRAAQMPSNFGAPLKCGFYDNDAHNLDGDVPDTTHNWTHLIASRHRDLNNNHQLQVAASYTENDRLFFRKIAGGDLTPRNPTWNEVATRGPNTFDGNQAITGSAQVTTHLSAGPFDVGAAQGRVSVTGGNAEFSFAKRSLTSWPLTPQAGDRYVWYNDNAGDAHLWTEVRGDILTAYSDGFALMVKGRGGESAYLGGDASGNDVQVGSQNPGISKVSFWNSTTSPGWMDIHYRSKTEHSDRRSKRKIRTLKGALDGLRNLRGVSFEWKADAVGARQFGFVAQEVRKVFPDLVSESRGGLGMNYNGLVAVLVEAVKEQQSLIDRLRKEVDALKASLAPPASPAPRKSGPRAAPKSGTKPRSR